MNALNLNTGCIQCDVPEAERPSSIVHLVRADGLYSGQSFCSWRCLHVFARRQAQEEWEQEWEKIDGSS